MAVRIQFRRGTAAEWTSANPTLAAGEVGYETDTYLFKIGDGSADWSNLTYSAATTDYVDNAIANVIDLAPGALDTLNELAAAIGDDADFVNTINNTIDTHTAATTNVHGIANTALLETTTGSQDKANTALASANQYTDNAVNSLIDSAPGALDTLNELANALGDDANFSTTITNNLANKLSFEKDTYNNYVSANAVTTANVVYLPTGEEEYAKIGDGTTNYNDLPFIGQGYTDNAIATHANVTTNIHGIADTDNLVYQNTVDTLTTDLSDHSNATTTVHGIADTSDLLVTADLTDHNNATAVHGITNTLDLVTSTDLSNAINTHESDTSNVHGIADTSLLALGSDITNAINTHDNSTNVHGIANTLDLVQNATLNDYATLASPSFTGTVNLPADTTIGNVSSTELSYVANVSSDIQAQLDDKAPLSNATFSGTVSLPTTTSIGDVDATEISYLNGVSSALQAQIDGKLASSTASTTYAPIANATLSGTVSLPATTSIGDVSATEIGYLNNVSSAIQTQLDAKAPTASPTFTGTVSGVTASMVGLGNVDNTSDANKPVSSATQTALNAKLSLAGGTMTGKITLDGDPTQALHAVTKQYADSISEGLHIHPAVVAATTGNIDLTGGTFGGTMDGVTLSDGDRVLVKDQTSAPENGIYVYTASGSTFARATDFDTPTEVAGGDFVFVLGGTLYDNTGWVQVAEAVTTIGTDDITFTQFSGAGSITGGNNISVSGTTISLADAPTLTDKLTVSSNGIQFSDNTIQTSAGVPSLTGFTEKTASYTLDTLDHQDNVVEMNSASALTFTIPTNTALAWPVGASMDIIQTGAGQVTISPDTGVTLNYTPGNKLRTQWSSCTIMKRATDSWIVYGDLTA